ncbi:hypothetical protein ACFOG5_12120 [Pedobacter fastidiosus]|uniref:Uncharacterized protein n=1 Tax=Pedobacter fastidiosus TaxID=2765361 RepID=A0ABR7KWM4_9SPHI|nr:hypothetical protein [Pedobacter fastidiosus]MBC6112504.1 hypothetical protein [Pedobacter fastidiosus]
MKTVLKFFIASFVSFFMMIGALGSSGYKSVFLIGLALVVWIIFIKSVTAISNSQRASRKDFEEFMKYKKRGY